MKYFQKFSLTVSILLFTAGITSAQTKMLTMEDVVLGAKRGLVPEKMEQLQWVADSKSYSYIRKENKTATLVSETVNGKESRNLVSLAQLNAILKSKGRDTLMDFPPVNWVTPDRFVFTANERTFDFVISNSTVNMLLDKPQDGAAHMEINPAYNAVAYTIDNNLWVMTSHRRMEVTTDSIPGIINGQTVHREEFGIEKGTFWSPSGKLLAFYRMDETMVTDYPLLNLEKKPAGASTIKYPMAGQKSHHVTIGVFNVETGKTIFLKTGEPAEQYLTNIAWSPDDSKILVAVLNRDQNQMKLNRYDAVTGNFEATLFEETSKSYVQPLHPAIFSGDGSKFVWISRRDGYNHLYLYEKSGKLIKQLTQGKWEIVSCLGFNSKNDKIGFVANKENPIDRDLYTVSVPGGSVKRASSGRGVHKGTMDNSGSLFIDELSAPGIPRKYSIVSSSGGEEKVLFTAPDPLKDYVPVQREIFTLKTENGDSVYCRMLKPAGFDSTKMYPVVVYVYGGPGVNLITDNWTGGADSWQMFMAQRGYIVFTLENRGTPNRGAAFEQVTFRNLGDVEMQDQLLGVKYLMKQRFVDRNKMGVFGWSYGGFMSASLMTRQPGTFRAGVAGGPVTDWSMYEVMYTERYMDTPETNPVGYNKSNLLNWIDKLTGKMLVIHGTSDDVVLWQHSLAYLKKAVDKNVQLDYFVYPGHKHNVSGQDRVHLMNKVSNYFFENLK